MQVAYGGGSVVIPAGTRYFAHALGRTLVGWHGTMAIAAELMHRTGPSEHWHEPGPRA